MCTYKHSDTLMLLLHLTVPTWCTHTGGTQSSSYADYLTDTFISLPLSSSHFPPLALQCMQHQLNCCTVSLLFIITWHSYYYHPSGTHCSRGRQQDQMTLLQGVLISKSVKCCAAGQIWCNMLTTADHVSDDKNETLVLKWRMSARELRLHISLMSKADVCLTVQQVDWFVEQMMVKLQSPG